MTPAQEARLAAAEARMDLIQQRLDALDLPCPNCGHRRDRVRLTVVEGSE